MTTMRIVLAALLGALALGAVACGSEEVAAQTPSSAGLLRPGAIAYWQTVSDPDSAQWKQAEELINRFPDGDKWIAELKAKLLRDKKVSWEDDVRPALGDVVDLAAYAADLAQACCRRADESQGSGQAPGARSQARRGRGWRSEGHARGRRLGCDLGQPGGDRRGAQGGRRRIAGGRAELQVGDERPPGRRAQPRLRRPGPSARARTSGSSARR